MLSLHDPFLSPIDANIDTALLLPVPFYFVLQALLITFAEMNFLHFNLIDNGLEALPAVDFVKDDETTASIWTDYGRVGRGWGMISAITRLARHNLSPEGMLIRSALH